MDTADASVQRACVCVLRSGIQWGGRVLAQIQISIKSNLTRKSPVSARIHRIWCESPLVALGRVHVRPNTSVSILMRPFYPRGLLILFLVIDLAMKPIFQSKSLIVQIFGLMSPARECWKGNMDLNEKLHKSVFSYDWSLAFMSIQS